LIPILERIVPGASTSIVRNIDLLADDADYLSQLAHAGFGACCLMRGRCIQISREPFRAHPPSLQRRIVALAIQAISDQVELTRERVEALRSALLSGAVSRTIEVCGDISAWVDYDVVMLGPNDAIEPELRSRRGLPELEPGSVLAIDGSTTVQVGPRWEIAIVSSCRLVGWELRTRHPGDRLLFADGRRLRMQDWLVNQKVPAYLRDSLPLLVQDGVVRWVAGISASSFEDVNSGLVARLVERPGNDRLDGEQSSGY
jgi:hypothetical protein